MEVDYFDRVYDTEGNVYRNVSLNREIAGEDRLFDNSGKLYRDLASRMDDAKIVEENLILDEDGMAVENVILDEDGKTYRVVNDIMNTAETIEKRFRGDGEDCEYEPEDRTGKSYIAVGKEVSVDKDVLIGPEDRKSSIGIGAKEAAETYKGLNSSMDFGMNVDEIVDRIKRAEDRTYKALNPNENVEEDYYSVVGRMKDIYAAKNSDYGNSFEMTLDKYGIIGAIIRMQDKMNRIDGYYWKADEDKKVDESLIDTLEDLGNYAIMTSVWLRNQ